MAISDRLTKLSEDITSAYKSINDLGGTIPAHKNTENISVAIDSIYNRLPKVSGTGSDITLTPTLKGRLGSVLKGDTLQDGTPTPDNEVPIQCVEGIQNISVYGKNLFDKDGTNFDGHTGINNFNGKQIASNTFVGATCYNLISNNARCQAYFKGQAGQTYYLSFGSKFGITANKAFGSDGIITATLPTQNTITMTTDYVGITLKKADNTDFTDEEVLELKNSLQIEKGTSATTYQPYQTPQTQEVDLIGKNLFDNNIGVKLNYSATGSKIDTGMRAIQTTSGTYKYFTMILPNSNELVGKTLTLSANIEPSSNNIGRIGVFKILKTNRKY